MIRLYYIDYDYTLSDMETEIRKQDVKGDNK